jgi:hypothetical protein
MFSFFSKPIKLDQGLVDKLRAISYGFYARHNGPDGLPKHYDTASEAFDLANKLEQGLRHGRANFVDWEEREATRLLREGKEFISP